MAEYLDWYEILQTIVFVVSKETRIPQSIDDSSQAYIVDLENLAHMNIDGEGTGPDHVALPTVPAPQERQDENPNQGVSSLSASEIVSPVMKEERPEKDKEVWDAFDNILLQEFFETAKEHSEYMSRYVEYCTQLDENDFKNDQRLEDVRILSYPVIDDKFVYTLCHSTLFDDFRKSIGADEDTARDEVSGWKSITNVLYKQEAPTKQLISIFPHYLQDFIRAHWDTFQEYIDAEPKKSRKVTFSESVEVHAESSITPVVETVYEEKKTIKHRIENPILNEFFQKTYNHSSFLKPFVEYCLGLNDDPRSDEVRILSNPVIDDTYVYTLFNSRMFSKFQIEHKQYFSSNYYEILGCVMVTRVVMKPETVAEDNVDINLFPKYLQDVFVAFRDTFETHIDFDDK